MSVTLQPARNGWHWKPWSAEFGGTAVLMFAVVTTWYWLVRAGSPWGDFGVRVPILAVVAGGVVVAVAYSPWGRWSGAHLNPAVTLGLYAQKVVGPADLAGYVIAQLLGGTAGFALGRVWGAGVAAPGVSWAAIAPPDTIPEWLAALGELGATAVQLFIVYTILTKARLAKWAGVAGGVLLALAIATLAGVTGAGFNPVRGLGPDLVRGEYPAAWIYLAGPLTGTLVAAALTLIVTRARPKTGKLHHDPDVPCYMRCVLPHSKSSDAPDAEQIPVAVR